MKIKVSPDNIMCLYFVVSMLLSALLPWSNVNTVILPILVGGYHILYWIAFGIYASLYYRQN